MPIEVRRFGVGHRRAEGPPGTVGVQGGSLESRASGSVAELVLGRVARLAPHASPRTTLFIVVEGGGWVGVGDERTRVSAGEAAVWPPHVVHAAWTEGMPMRAIVVELAEDPKLLAVEAVEAFGASDGRPGAQSVSRGEGTLAPRPSQGRAKPSEGEPA